MQFLGEILKERGSILCLFPLPSGWNVNMMAGESAAILGHEVLRSVEQ